VVAECLDIVKLTSSRLDFFSRDIHVASAICNQKKHFIVSISGRPWSMQKVFSTVLVSRPFEVYVVLSGSCATARQRDVT
jgi:hypothetical protein